MNDLRNALEKINVAADRSPDMVRREVKNAITSGGYRLFDVDETKPWGAYYRIEDSQTQQFLQEFFPGLSLDEAQLGNPNAALSPKILLVIPGQRLSWQYHGRRAERWMFLTAGGYHKSETDEQGNLQIAQPDQTVQFAAGERHRLVASSNQFTLVAEIWQHIDKTHLSEEADIVRVSDDYNR